MKVLFLSACVIYSNIYFALILIFDLKAEMINFIFVSENRVSCTLTVK